MQTLTLDAPPLRFCLDPTLPIHLVVVGCGGTGSFVLQSLARLCVHAQASGLPPLTVTALDGDYVETRNVGRQLFAPAEVGHNKAMTLVQRLNGAFGLRWTAIPMMATADLLRTIAGTSIGATTMLVGCVDSAHGRQAMHAALEHSRCRLWIDSGNHDRSGQVVVGSTTRQTDLTHAFLLSGLTTQLPAASLVYPELLVEPPAPPESCAVALEANHQDIMINQMMATIVTRYLAQLTQDHQITTWQTVVDLTTLSMRSTPISRESIQPYVDMEESHEDR